VILGRIVCLFKGHRRGKFDRKVTPDDGASIWSVFICPRCGRETRYKIKPMPAEAPAVKPASITVQEANAEYIAKRKL
jgi:hypothetical protein